MDVVRISQGKDINCINCINWFFGMREGTA